MVPSLVELVPGDPATGQPSFLRQLYRDGDVCQAQESVPSPPPGLFPAEENSRQRRRRAEVQFRCPDEVHEFEPPPVFFHGIGTPKVVHNPLDILEFLRNKPLHEQVRAMVAQSRSVEPPALYSPGVSIRQVTEDAHCRYTIILETPTLCDVEGFRRKSKNKNPPVRWQCVQMPEHVADASGGESLLPSSFGGWTPPSLFAQQ